MSEENTTKDKLDESNPFIKKQAPKAPSANQANQNGEIEIPITYVKTSKNSKSGETQDQNIDEKRKSVEIPIEIEQSEQKYTLPPLPSSMPPRKRSVDSENNDEHSEEKDPNQSSIEIDRRAYTDDNRSSRKSSYDNGDKRKSSVDKFIDQTENTSNSTNQDAQSSVKSNEQKPINSNIQKEKKPNALMRFFGNFSCVSGKAHKAKN